MHFDKVLASSAMEAVAAASSCTFIGYVDTTDATSIATQGATNLNEYFMGWTRSKTVASLPPLNTETVVQVSTSLLCLTLHYYILRQLWGFL